MQSLCISERGAARKRNACCPSDWVDQSRICNRSQHECKWKLMLCNQAKFDELLFPYRKQEIINQNKDDHLTNILTFQYHRGRSHIDIFGYAGWAVEVSCPPTHWQLHQGASWWIQGVHDQVSWTKAHAYLTRTTSSFDAGRPSYFARCKEAEVLTIVCR